jgi:hypothetical protein
MMRRRTEGESGRKIIIDTNILLLIVVGKYDPSLISRFKRTSRYNAGDYALVTDRLVGQPNSALLTTPHVLTEVSNLLGQLYEPARTDCRRILGVLIGGMAERTLPSRDLVPQPSFVTLGIADAVIEQLADSNTTVVTDDFELGGRLQGRSDVWNLRAMRNPI